MALSLVPAQPRRDLIPRLRADDPVLREAVERHLPAARALRLAAEVRGIVPLAWDDPRYPAPLLAIHDPPVVLWYRGQIDALQRPAVAIVGSRSAGAAAIETAQRLGEDLAARGITVVSGLARGVDSAAHRGALRSGCTIAVLGSGLDCVYPPEHAGLARQIAERGLVVSEFPPAAPPLKFHFPLRNRVISGLSRAVVIVEASERSGSLITAACALEQGRDVMAVPGPVLGGRNRGAHALIRDGASIVECADDIVEELGWGVPRAGADATTCDAATCDTATTCDPLLAVMASGDAYDLDALAAAAGVDGVRLLPRLLELELQGRIARVEGGRFMRPRRTC